ncbi:Uncharacterized protein Fot_57596 [Forsythia ovata]|uniref:Uncharacterized protein n=1 Tax=Forsythia ovata TaxID=205694 RepID=A0ABD1NUT5_9LAMI
MGEQVFDLSSVKPHEFVQYGLACLKKFASLDKALHLFINKHGKKELEVEGELPEKNRDALTPGVNNFGILKSGIPELKFHNDEILKLWIFRKHDFLSAFLGLSNGGVTAMSAYGFEMLLTLIVDIEPDAQVMRATNEINSVEQVSNSSDMLDELCKYGLVQQVLSLIELRSQTILHQPTYLMRTVLKLLNELLPTVARENRMLN